MVRSMQLNESNAGRTNARLVRSVALTVILATATSIWCSGSPAQAASFRPVREVSAPVRLKCERRHNPLATNSLHPGLSWELPWTGRGTFQTAYQILVASSPRLLAENKADLWEMQSAVPSSQSIDIPYSGKSLTSRERCFWKVRVWNQDGQPSRWSQIGEWQEGLLTREQWHGAQWIGWRPPSDTGAEHPLPAIYLRHQFPVHKPVQRAVAYLCGLGLSHLYVNGTPASDAQLSPPLSWYPERYYYVAYDVTSLLRQGDNAIGVILGNGRAFGMSKRYTVHISPRMLLALYITFTDGSTAVVTSGSQWQMTDHGPIRMNNEYDGETYDATLRMPGWSEAGFEGKDWKSAVPLVASSERLLAQYQYPIRVTRVFHPVKMLRIAPGAWVFDMGQVIAGWCQINIPSAPAGTKVVLRYSESLVRDGKQTTDLTPAGKGTIQLSLANLSHAEAVDTVLLAGKSRLTWHPLFTYHSFRFVEVTGFPGTPTPSTIEGQAVHDDLPVSGAFTSSDKLVDQIVHNSRWSIENNYRSIPTDNATRAERQGWMGDRGMESRSETFLFDTELFHDKWLWDIQDGQLPNGDISAVSPPYWAEYKHGITWPSTFIYLPGTLYLQYGPLSPLREHYAEMSEWINYELAGVNDGITVDDLYGDWCPPAESPRLIHTQDPDRLTSKAILATATLYKDLRLMAWYADLLQMPEDQKHWLNEADKLYAGFNKHLWNAKEGYYDNGSDTACILPLAAGIVPKDRQDAVIKRLVWLIKNRQGGHVGVGLIGMQWMFDVLAKYGHSDLAWEMLNQTTYPGWGYMVQNGATTIWELWNGNTADPSMDSQDHIMLIGDMITWLFQSVAGIQSDAHEPGFKRVIMSPHLLKGLTYVHAWHRSPYGKIISDWRIVPGGALEWHVRIPANSFATLKIPATSATSVALDGDTIRDERWIKFVTFADGQAVYAVGSGDYSFRSKLPRHD